MDNDQEVVEQILRGGGWMSIADIMAKSRGGYTLSTSRVYLALVRLQTSGVVNKKQQDGGGSLFELRKK